MLFTIWYQFKKREKYPWRSVTYSKVLGFSLGSTNSNNSPLAFFTFFNLRKWYQIARSITYERPTKDIVILTILQTALKSKVGMEL